MSIRSLSSVIPVQTGVQASQDILDLGQRLGDGLFGGHLILYSMALYLVLRLPVPSFCFAVLCFLTTAGRERWSKGPVHD